MTTKEELYATVANSVRGFPQQLASGYNKSLLTHFTSSYKNVENIIFCGMGGSSIPAHILTTALTINKPFILIKDYRLPTWTNSKSLVIAASYSGNTEETLSCATQAMEMKARLIGVSSGGKLERLLLKNDYPVIIFDEIFNPSGQPRIGMGYSLGAQFGILNALGLLNEDVNLLELAEEISAKTGIELNAQNIITQIENNICLILAGEHLQGSAHVLANQLNETAKTLAFPFYLPEANHHLLEGLQKPKRKRLAGILIFSDKYSSKLKKRLILTKDVFEKNKAKVVTVEVSGKTQFSEALHLIMLSSWTTLGLAKEYKLDPIAIPWVEYFKEKLAA